jgi:tRNA (guanine-N7-)-methyltransferase
MTKPRQLYGRHRGHRLRPGRVRLLEERLPQLRIELPEGGLLDAAALFPRPCPLWLEIGFGGGEHLIWQAREHPEVGLIGCEPFINGVARLLALAEAEAIENVRVAVDDARPLLDALPEASLERIFVLFPDPWPKARHHKRRLVNGATATRFGQLLRPGGELRLATDDMGYARVMLQAMLSRPEFAWQAERPSDWRLRPPDWPPTRYERKALEAGRSSVYLRFFRIGRAGEKTLKTGAEERI